jgi:MFS family permease
MIPRRNSKQNVKWIVMGIIGIILTTAYFFLVTTSPLVDFLQPRESREKILSMAESFCQHLSINHHRFDRSTSAGIDEDLLAYAQYYREKNKQYPDLVPGFWIIDWHLASDSNKPYQSRDFFQIRYDFKGNLLGFRDNTSDPAAAESNNNISEEDALFEAKYFLEEYGIKTDSLEVVNREIARKGPRTQYKFVLENKSEAYTGLLDQYTVELVGSRITSYQLDRAIDKKKIKIAGISKNKGISGILVAITWAIIILTLVVRFIKKLRRDELEFKRALWIGMGLGLGGFILVAISAWRMGSWVEILIGGGMIAVLILLGLLIALPIAESQTRAVWPEKLTSFDLLFQGKILIRETGAAILRSFFLVGVILLIFGALIRAVTTFNIGYISLDSDMINVFQNPTQGISVIMENILLTAFFGLTILSFWPGFLKEKFRNNTLLLVLLVVSFNLGGLQSGFFSPPLLAFILVLPIAFLWAVIVYKYDLLTILFSFMGAKLMLDLALVSLKPGVLYTLPGMIVLIFALFFFLLGISLVFRPRSAGDYESYVPEYVNRIAERERLLRELEIARSVQMRFLPQEIPEFPSLEIVSLCQPAMEVGGDYYDFIQINDRYMSVLIGDVSGKGVSAAFYMTMVKGIIKTLSKKTRKPATLLAEANEIFCENAPRNVFITIIYGIFDLKEKTLTIASAGHNPLITWKKETNTTQMVNPRGIALGLDKGQLCETIIEEIAIPIAAGDVFVFYTDGVSESMNTREEIFGEERLCEIIKKSAHLPPRIIQKNIVESVSRFSGNAPQHDDFTMVVVKVKD